MRGRRFKMSRGRSKRSFTKGALRVHKRNVLSTVPSGPMRGGIRM